MVANEEIIQAYTNANTIINLACGNLGPAMVGSQFSSGDIISIGHQVVKPLSATSGANVSTYKKLYGQNSLSCAST